MALQDSIENPLIWPLLTILKASSQSHKIHQLASELQELGLLADLDSDPNKALFKRNFLLMNALYQLQAMLLPEYWLQVRSLDIQLLTQIPSDLAITLEQDVALRQYYLNWDYFETSPEEIESLLSQFWGKYGQSIGRTQKQMDKTSALQVFELDERASAQDIRRQWRKLALKWHPDRRAGNATNFRLVCEAWQTLRES